MKKLTNLLMLAIMAVCFVGCNNDDNEEDLIWDIPGYEIGFYVQDAEGNNLLDPAVSNNICEEPVKVEFDGKTYEKETQAEITMPKTKALPITMYGLLAQIDKDGNHYLGYGDLHGTETYTNEPIKIIWKDGTSDVVQVSNKIKWKNGKPNIQRSFKLNGKTYQSEMISSSSLRRYVVYKFIITK